MRSGYSSLPLVLVDAASNHSAREMLGILSISHTGVGTGVPSLGSKEPPAMILRWPALLDIVTAPLFGSMRLHVLIWLPARLRAKERPQVVLLQPTHLIRYTESTCEQRQGMYPLVRS